MLKWIVFSLLFWQQQAQAAARCEELFSVPQTPAAQEFLRHVNENTPLEQVTLIAEHAIEKNIAHLTKEDVIFLNSWKYGNNLGYSQLSQLLTTLTEESPLTTPQLKQIIQNMDANEAAYFLWSIGVQKPRETWKKQVTIEGSARDILDVLLAKRSSLGRNGRTFMRETFYASFAESLRSMSLSKEDLTYFLRKLPAKQFDLRGLHTFISALGFEQLMDVPSNVLLTRIDFNLGEGYHKSSYSEAAALVLAYPQQQLSAQQMMNTLTTVGFPHEVLTELYLLKQEALEQLESANVPDLYLSHYYSRVMDLTTGNYYDLPLNQYKTVSQFLSQHKELVPQLDVVLNLVEKLRENVFPRNFEFEDTVALKLLSEKIPELANVEAQQLQMFLDLYLRELNAQRSLMEAKYIHPHSTRLYRSIEAGLDLYLLHQETQKAMGANEIQLYFALLQGGIISKPKMTIWESFFGPQELPALDHGQAMEQLRELLSK